MSIDAMKQALAALEQYTNVVTSVNDPNSWASFSDGGKPARDAITALRAAIKQAQRNEFNPDWDQVEALRESLREHMAEIQRLRQWQGLTADEIWDEWCKQTKPERDTRNFVAAFAIAIEAKLRAKNT